jgi:hypothetical protein
MNKLFTLIVTASGYKSTDHFVNSTFHPDFVTQSTAISGALAAVAYYFQAVFGFQLPVGAVILVLFFMEMYTGIKASKKEGCGWESEQFGKGWLKLAVYWIMIGCTNILDLYAKSPTVLGYEIDIYAFVHFAWLNFVILQLLGSNIENFIRLGWDKKSMLVRILAKIYNIKDKEDGRTN